MTSLEPTVAVPLPKEEDKEVAPLSPKTTETSETVAVISPPSSPTLDFDDLVQQIEPLEGIDPLSAIDPLDWDLGDDNESLVLDDDVVAALWNIGEPNSLEEIVHSPATPPEEVPETKPAVVEDEPNTSDPQEKGSVDLPSEESKTENSKEDKGEKTGEAKEESSDPQQNGEGTDGLPSYLYCQPINPSTKEAEALPPQLLQTLMQQAQSPKLTREQLLDGVAGLDLGSLAQLALYSDQLNGSDQDYLLSLLEEATGIKQIDQDLLDLEGENLFAELNGLGFGGLAEIAQEASNEPTLICQPCAPKPAGSATEGENEAKPGTTSNEKPKEETDSTKPPAAKEQTGEETAAAAANKDESKEKERIRIQEQKLNAALNPTKEDLLELLGAAIETDSPLLESEQFSPEDLNLGNAEDMPLRFPDDPIPESTPRIVELKDESDENEKPKAVEDDLDNDENQEEDKSKPGPRAPTKVEAKSPGGGSGSKNKAFLARLREHQAEAKRKEEEEIQQKPPLHVTDAFKGCMPCIPRNFRIIKTKKSETTSNVTNGQTPVQNQSSEKKSLPVTQDGDSITKPAHPQEQDSTGASNDTADPPAQNSQAQEQEQQQQNDGHEEQAGDYNPARPEAWDLAGGLLKTFGLIEGSKKKEQSCFGHKEKIFGVSFSECGNFCASASQDSCINIWDVKKNALLTSLKGHSRDYECLRVVWASSAWSSNILDRTSNFQYLLASSGADGTVRFWACKDPRIKQGREGSWKCCMKFDHVDLRSKQSEVGKKLGSIAEDEDKEEKEGDKDKPQVYSLQFIDHWQAFNNNMGVETKNAFFMSSSDDYVHFWELEIKSGMEQVLTMGEDQEISLKLRPDEMGLKEVFSLHFGNMNQYYYGVEIVNVTEQGLRVGGADCTENCPPDCKACKPVNIFGGERNPNNLVYVFDASYCPTNGLLGVALSDGSLRLHNGRGHCVSVMNLPGVNSHLTSFAWDRSGERLVTTVATGHLISWHIHMGDVQGNGNAKAVCMSIMEGGHEPGRPIFGAKYLGGEHEHLILSWGIDGSLCLWDSYLQGNVHVPMAVLRRDDQYPIYAVDVHHEKKVLAIAGGTDGGFIGTPLYLYNYKQNDENQGEASKSKKEAESKTDESKTDEFGVFWV